MLVGECEELDTKIAWKLAENSSQLDGMGDLNECITFLRQASEHSIAAQDYDAHAQSTEEYVVHLLNLANDVTVFDEDRDNENPLITSLLNSVKELKRERWKWGLLFNWRASFHYLYLNIYRKA